MAGLVVRIVAALAAAYFLGGVPFSLLVSKRFYGVDLREHGSGNLGATNVLRTLGVKAALATAIPDVVKGSAAVLLAGLLVPASGFGGVAAHEWTRVIAMVAAVMGHAYSPYVRMHGGKGVATSAGGLLVLTPLAVVIEFLLFVGLVTVTRIVSLASLIIAVLYPILVIWLYPGDMPRLITGLFIAALVIWRHRSNIGRIVRGEERKLSLPRRGEAPSDSEG